MSARDDALRRLTEVEEALAADVALSRVERQALAEVLAEAYADYCVATGYNGPLHGDDTPRGVSTADLERFAEMNDGLG